MIMAGKIRKGASIMNGKNKCKILKDIRRQIAQDNDIEFVTSECKYQGDCTGTCPKCEAELRYLEQELAKRQAAGKAIAVAGISAALVVGAAGCGMDGIAPSSATSGVFEPPASTTQTDPTKVEVAGALDPSTPTIADPTDPTNPTNPTNPTDSTDPTDPTCSTYPPTAGVPAPPDWEQELSGDPTSEYIFSGFVLEP